MIQKQLSREEMQEWVKTLVHQIKLPLVIGLSGPMGAGKTTFVKALVQELGGGSEADSPTYALINEYETKRFPIYHVDLYRLEDEGDLESTGFWDLFSEPEHLLIVEWFDRLEAQVVPSNWSLWNFQFSYLKDSPEKRLITFSD